MNDVVKKMFGHRHLHILWYFGPRGIFKELRWKGQIKLMDLYCCFLDFAYNQWPTNKMQGISQIGEIVAERGLYKIDLVSKSATLSLSFNHIGDLTCFFLILLLVMILKSFRFPSIKKNRLSMYLKFEPSNHASLD